MKISFLKTGSILLIFLLAVPQGIFAQSGSGSKTFSPEELNQLIAPIALYPDSLLAQIFMASTYPLEVVQAARWAKENKNLKGDALTAALEKQSWDPSVKSLVNFPQVLNMMNEKLDWTQKLGDAFLAQQKDVMDTVQKLRQKASAEGNLKSTEQQTVVVQKETQTIVIEPANPQVVYVPAYNPTVVYGAWAYPAYPPYSYYPPGYVPGAALFSFGVGVAVGAAWGYAWGNCNWNRGDVNINVNQNTNINNRINRGNYQNISTGQGGRGAWQHNPEHRKGVSYRDQTTAQRYDRAGSTRNVQSREAFRGRAEAGRQNIARGGADQYRDRSGSGRPDTQGRNNAGISSREGTQQPRKSAGSMDRASTQPRSDRSAFSNNGRGSQTNDFSNRGNQSISSSRSGGNRGAMSSGSRGGAGGGGGGGRGGGGRR